MSTEIPPPVKFLIAVLIRRETSGEHLHPVLAERFGKIDFIGRRYSFDVTDYYSREMGTSLDRYLVAFAGRASPEGLVEAKRWCITLEMEHARGGNRTVNLDVGYLDHNKIVLASTKEAGQKIYLQDGIYADLVARYKGGTYQPFEWTFPDFKDGRYDGELLLIRKLHLEERLR